MEHIVREMFICSCFIKLQNDQDYTIHIKEESGHVMKRDELDLFYSFFTTKFTIFFILIIKFRRICACKRHLVKRSRPENTEIARKENEQIQELGRYKNHKTSTIIGNVSKCIPKAGRMWLSLTNAADKGGWLWFSEVPLSDPDRVLSRSSRTVANFVVLVQQLIVTDKMVYWSNELHLKNYSCVDKDYL